ncbi:50S ribosomal protein L25/general stress protein Ctc [Pseudochelatococcus contaminans]|uniref:Large ribosomal subunit protein bL25 n=1 Tax=Pseudochelatococcus contaminans TaxID=1538103 RepID=A0A7W6EHH3_9HYPH|nr:50S ribosomal protein L25/general stress protein Ctc [Pseudochelatococcus contaminans]MBB3810125.1 large subunit ribosomal protein L25 [Pseudochelatococcus contaminans]
MSAAKQLNATAREGVGKGAARAIRRQGRVPAVIYGLGAPAQPISLDFNETKRLIYAGGFLSTLFEIEVEGKKTRVIPRDYQLDKVKDFPLHVDFLRVAKGAKIEVEVPLHVVGDEDAPGVKNGGTLNIVHHKVAILVEPEKIPGSIEIDVSKLEIGDSIHFTAIALPAGIEFAPGVDESEAVVTIVPPAASEETEEAPAEA